MIALVGLLTPMNDACAQWPQFGGPTRDFTLPAGNLKLDWPDGGPKRLWDRPLGEGYAGLSVVDGTLYTMYRTDDREVIVAVDADSGKTRWEHTYPAKLYSQMYSDRGNGPRSTPLVSGDRIFTVGISAKMCCLDKAKGIVHWSHDLMKEYDATPLLWGYSSSALRYRDTVIVPVGGKGHSVMAFKVSDGSIAWSRHDFPNAYSSPMLIDVDGQTQLVIFMQPAVIGLDPENGDLLWSHPHETNYNVNASLPIWGDDNILFISSAYNAGSRGLKLTRQGGKTVVEQLWTERKMQIHFGDGIRIGDYVYASSGGNGPVFFSAINVKTGKIAFRQRRVISKTQILRIGDQLIMLGEDGELAGATVTPKAVTVHSKVKLLDRVAWTAPTFVDGRLFLRDNKTMMALDLRAAP